MLLFKKIDLLVQVTLFMFVLVGLPTRVEPAFIGLLALGGIQLISTFVHLFFPADFRIQKLRVFYYSLLLFALIFFFLLIIVEMGGISGFIFYTIGTVLMAIYYMIICTLELRRISKMTITQNRHI